MFEMYGIMFEIMIETFEVLKKFEMLKMFEIFEIMLEWFIMFKKL